MMRYVVCAVRDRAANTFGTPFYSVAVQSALRNFQDAINNSQDGNVMNHHPEDFDLYHLGYFHDSNGKFECLESPVQLAVGKDVVMKPLSLSSVGRTVS